ncbi:DUF1456 family protein [Reinekea marina]|uniref:DUF1456 family protein n=1 Tax=Reinekea marina TaxID=1310421 RepID=A0ABV7WMI8_9GAMM|nr:DUF1456 family protein [Reinekea marina]MDN3649491.1 DUF1456 family protein [Reinekea marina]
MTNNDVLRKIRFIYDLKDDAMIKIFSLGGLNVTRAEVSDWLKSDKDEAYKALKDPALAQFLNGFIVKLRGKKEGAEPVVETKLNNNIVLRKLKIALNLQAEDILATLQLADFRLSKSELSAFFRKPDHQHFRPCKDQVLRNFLQGLQNKHRPK